LGDLIGEGDALIAQVLKAFEIIDVLLDLWGFVGRDVAVEFFAFVEALQIEIRALGHCFAALFLGKNLAAESAAPQAVNGLELGHESLTMRGKLFDCVWHGSYYIYIDIICHKKTRLQKAFIALGYFPVTHPMRTIRPNRASS
jgi:hypothetical protein